MRRLRPFFAMWDGEHFVPNKAFAKYCDRMFTIGETYPLMVQEERNMASHRHYFAALKEGFNNLSEENAERFPTAEHLRHWALVQCGYATEQSFVMSNYEEAFRLAKEMRLLDAFAILMLPKGSNVLKIWHAESQSLAAMKKERFEQSKADVLDLVASMSRTTRGQLNREARHNGR